MVGDPLLQVNNQALLQWYIVFGDRLRHIPHVGGCRVVSCQAIIICKAQELTGEGFDEGCGSQQPSTLILHCELGDEACMADTICTR